MLEDKNFKYDYKKYPLGYVVPDIENKIVEIVKGEKNHGFKSFIEAKEWAKTNIVKVYSDEQTGGKGEILISNNSISKYLSKSAVIKSDSIDVHLSVLKIFPEIIKKSVVAEIHPDFVKNKDNRNPTNGINYNTLIIRVFGAIIIENDMFRVKTTIKKSTDSTVFHNPYSYEATKIELLDGTLNNTSEDMVSKYNSSIFNQETESLDGQHGITVCDAAIPRNSNLSISAAKLLKNVEMSYQKGKYFFTD